MYLLFGIFAELIADGYKVCSSVGAIEDEHWNVLLGGLKHRLHCIYPTLHHQHHHRYIHTYKNEKCWYMQ